MKRYLKDMMPPILARCFSKMLGRQMEFFGEFGTFQKACEYANAYNQRIGYRGVDKDKIIQSTRKIEVDHQTRSGNNNLIASILAVGMMKNARNISFLDLGGGGTFYFLNRTKFFSLFENYDYQVLEIQEIAQIGKEFLADDRLSFCSDLNEIADSNCDTRVLILQGVLMYLDDPLEYLKQILSKVSFDLVILDRTAFSRDNQIHYKVQKIPKILGQRANPWTTFDKRAILDFFAKMGFLQFDDFDDPLDGDTGDFVMQGISFIKRDLLSFGVSV